MRYAKRAFVLLSAQERVATSDSHLLAFFYSLLDAGRPTTTSEAHDQYRDYQHQFPGDMPDLTTDDVQRTLDRMAELNLVIKHNPAD